MERQSTGLIAFLGGLAGLGIGLAVGFIGAVSFLAGDALEDLAGGLDDYVEYFDVRVLDYEKRDNGVYVKFENTGTEPVDDMYFEIEERDASGRLLDEYEVNYATIVPPGRIEEAILKPFDDDGVATIPAGIVRVKYSYGWVTVKSVEAEE